jgi:hypothetical protein
MKSTLLAAAVALGTILGIRQWLIARFLGFFDARGSDPERIPSMRGAIPIRIHEH